MKKRIAGLILMSLLAAAPMQAQTKPLPAAAEKVHQGLIKQLNADQIKALTKVYPGFRLLTVCAGHFSGSERNEFVLGVWKPVKAKQSWKSEVHRVGLIWHKNAWQVHLIDDEIEKDEKLSRSFPMSWHYTLDAKGFSGATKCGVQTEFGKNSDLTTALGDKPFFDLKQMGLQKHKVVCFATDDVYNNWDCVVYSPKDGRFRLWYQQAHAD